MLFSRFLGNYSVNAITSNTHTLRYFLDGLLGPQTYDLSEMFMMAKIKITDKEDNQIKSSVETSVVNDCLFSALKSMKVFINDKPIVSMPHFGYQQYFSKKLASDITAVNTYLTTEGYYEDDTFFFDTLDPGNPEDGSPNLGYRERKKLFAMEEPVKNSDGEITGY